MKLIKNSQITNYLNIAYQNISKPSTQEYLNYYLDPKEEKHIKKRLAKLGAQELIDNPNLSLFISTDEFVNSKYHQAIDLSKISTKEFSYERFEVEANYLFNFDQIQNDSKKALNDWMRLRALDKNMHVNVLKQTGEIWMLDVPSEAQTIDPCANKAKGKVLTFGLGIGYFIYMASLNPKVTSITVVERSSEVIEMFKECLLPQFPANLKLEIIHGDAFDYFNEDFIEQFDYTFVDIWRNESDGLELMSKLLEQYCPSLRKVDFWIENSCTEIMHTLIFLYFRNQLMPKVKINKEYQTYYQKIEEYHDINRGLISEVEQLQELIYDPMMIREILAQ